MHVSIKTSPVPHLREEQKKLGVPVIINEYAWLWLNRDGTPTTLTKKIFESLGLWPGGTVQERRELYARYLAALTEFWRCGRKAAGVLHFCGLGYSRPGFEDRPLGGATSDHFTDLENLTFEPNFEKYVCDAFAPVGVMVDFWDDTLAANTRWQIKVVVINDLYDDFNGVVALKLMLGRRLIAEQSQPCTVVGLGREELLFEQKLPAEMGGYTLVGELAAKGQRPIRSLRDFKVVANDK